MSAHVEILIKARAKMVEDRRDEAERIANPTSAAPSVRAPEFSRIQAAVEAIDAAIADEQKLADIGNKIRPD
jgi:hypothetical protein